MSQNLSSAAVVIGVGGYLLVCIFFIPDASLFIRLLENLVLDVIFPHNSHLKLGLAAKKPVFGVSEKARLKPAFSARETS